MTHEEQGRYEAIAALLEEYADEVVRSGEDHELVQETLDQAAWLRLRVKEARDAEQSDRR
jgi:predicted metal-dependent enzyme (double-stranded beta helix superfamily)